MTSKQMHYFSRGSHVMLLGFLRIGYMYMLYQLLFFFSASSVLYPIKIVVRVNSLLLSPRPWSIPTKYIDIVTLRVPAKPAGYRC